MALSAPLPQPVAKSVVKTLDPPAPMQPAQDKVATDSPLLHGSTMPREGEPRPLAPEEPPVASPPAGAQAKDSESLTLPISGIRWAPRGKWAVLIAGGAVASTALALALFATWRGRVEATTPASTMHLAQTSPAAEPTHSLPAQPETRPAETAPPTTAAAPVAAPSAATDADGISEDLKARGLGTVTVHSTGTHGSVYVMFTKYGQVENKIIVPCGKRFIGVGVPRRDSKEPTWLAPGSLVEIPCGGSVEMTMNPRRVDDRPKSAR
jgi:hypothetical protein